MSAPPRYRLAVALIISLFFLWGVANNLNDILIKQFKKTFELTDFHSGLVQSAFYMGYFLLAVPSALVMRRFGYKAGVTIGLLLYAAGAALFVPAAQVHWYSLFLAALFIIASGLAFLETCANPLITVLGAPDKAEQRLNLAQAFNPLGSIAGVVIGRQFILSGVEHTPAELKAMSPSALQAFLVREAHSVQAPYAVIALVVLLWALLVMATRFPTPREDSDRGEAGGFLGLLRRPRLLCGVLAQFFYVGAQVGVWSWTIRYAQHVAPGMGERQAADYLTASLVAFMVGRFVGSGLMTRLPAAPLCAAAAAVNVVLTGLVVFAPGQTGLYALVAISFFMSIMYPTIFATSIRGLGSLTKAGSSLLVMSIIGGAVYPLVMGRISDAFGIELAFVAPGVAFLVVSQFCLFAGRSREAAAADLVPGRAHV